MATNLLDVGTNTTPSDDFTVDSGEQITLVLKSNSESGNPPNAQVFLQVKDEDDNFWTVDTLTAHKSAVVLGAAGTYRLLRKAGGAAVGAFSA